MFKSFGHQAQSPESRSESRSSEGIRGEGSVGRSGWRSAVARSVRQATHVLNHPRPSERDLGGITVPHITYTPEIMIQYLAITERRPFPGDSGSIRSTSRARVRTVPTGGSQD